MHKVSSGTWTTTGGFFGDIFLSFFLSFLLDFNDELVTTEVLED
jgi:hypothetical protein